MSTKIFPLTVFLMGLVFLLNTTPLKSQIDGTKIPLESRQTLDAYAEVLNNIAKTHFYKKGSSVSDSFIYDKQIDSLHNTFINLFSSSNCIVTDDLSEYLSGNENSSTNLNEYLSSFEALNQRLYVIFSESSSEAGINFSNINLVDHFVHSDFTLAQIKADLSISVEDENFVQETITLTRFYTLISHKQKGSWQMKPGICRISVQKVPLKSFYPYQISLNALNRNTAKINNDISPQQFANFTALGLSIDFSFRNSKNALLMLNTGLRIQNQELGMYMQNYSDNVPNWKGQNGSTLLLEGKNIQQYLGYTHAIIPANLKYQYEGGKYFIFGYGGGSIGLLLKERNTLLSGSIKSSNIILDKETGAEYRLSNIPELELTSLTLAKITESRSFSPMSAGFQFGIGGGFNMNSNLKLGINLEFNRSYLFPVETKVDPGMVKPLSHTDKPYALDNLSGSLGLSYTLIDQTRPFFNSKEFVTSPSYRNYRRDKKHLILDLTRLNSVQVNKISYLIQDVSNNTIYSHGHIRTKKIKPLSFKAPDQTYLILDKPFGYDLVVKDNLGIINKREQLWIPTSIANSTENNPIMINPIKLKPVCIIFIYTGRSNNPTIVFQNSVWQDLQVISKNIPEDCERFVFIESQRIDKSFEVETFDDFNLESRIKDDIVESGITEDMLSFFDELDSNKYLNNRPVYIFAYVNTEESYLKHVKKSLTYLHNLKGTKDNWQNIELSIIADFNISKIKQRSGIIGSGWNFRKF